MDPNVDEENLFDDDDDLNEVQEDDDSPTDRFLTFTAPLPSLKDYEVIFEQQHPTTSQRRDIEKPSACHISASIDGSHKTMCEQAKLEINLVREKKGCLGWKRYNSREYMGSRPRFHALLVGRKIGTKQCVYQTSDCNI